MAASDDALRLLQIANACAELHELASETDELFLAHLLAMARAEAQQVISRRRLLDGDDGSSH